MDAFGGGASERAVADALEGVAKVGFDIAKEEKQKADQLVITDAERQLTELETKLQYDQDNGAMTKKGKEVYGLPDQIKESWTKGVEPITKNLHNETQRSAFKRSEQMRWASLDKNIQAHVASEIQKHDTEVTESYLANEQEASAANYLDAARISESIANQRTKLTEYANRNGFSTDWVEIKTKEAFGKTHAGVINQMLANGHDQTAQSYFEANKQTLSTKDAEEIKKTLSEGLLRGSSQRETDRLMNSHETWAERFEAAKNIKNDAVRDEVDKRLKTNLATEKLVQERTEEKLTMDATNIIEATRDFDQVPSAMVKRLSTSARKSLRAYADDLRQGKKAVTDWNEYYTLKTMAATPEFREKFLRTNLAEYRPLLGDSEFKEMVNLQTSLRYGKSDTELDGYRTKSQIIDGTLAGLGIDTTPNVSKSKGAKEAEKVNNFRKLVDDQLSALQQQTGKKASNKEVQAIVDRLIIEGSVPGSGFKGFFETKKRVFELAPGEAIESENQELISYGGIPAEDRAKIIEALKANGRAVTDEAILNLYLRKARRL